MVTLGQLRTEFGWFQIQIFTMAKSWNKISGLKEKSGNDSWEIGRIFSIISILFQKKFSNLKWQCHEIFHFWPFFQESNPPGPLINRLKGFCWKIHFRGDIREICDSAQTNTARSQTDFFAFQDPYLQVI